MDQLPRCHRPKCPLVGSRSGAQSRVPLWNIRKSCVSNTPSTQLLTRSQTVQTWKEKIGSPLRTKLVDGVIKMKIDELDIIGNKAIVESSGIATQKNGKSYNNRFVRYSKAVCAELIR